MHLYLRHNRVTREVPGITLKDGCIPVVGNQIPSKEADGKPLHVEPAVWFKVLILDSITIDCTKRGIKWMSKDNSSKKASSSDLIEGTVVNRRVKKRISQTLYSEEEYYNYQSNMDGMFLKAIEVMTAYSNMKITTYEFNETLLQLLHCFILPAIRLTVNDIPLVEQAYKLMEQHIEEKNREIVLKNTDIQRQKDAVTKLRRTFVDELQSDTHPIPPYPAQLQDYLLADLKTDIAHFWSELDICQRAVEEAKCENCKQDQQSHRNTDAHDTSFNSTTSTPIGMDSLQGFSIQYDDNSSFNSKSSNGLQLTDFLQPRRKSPTNGDQCLNCQTDLSAKRMARDQEYELYIKHLQAREHLMNLKTEPKRHSKSLSNAIRSSFRSLKGEKHDPSVYNPLYNMYTEHAKHLETRKEELLYLTHRKVLITSVKEALRAALSELRSGSDTFGIEIARSGNQRDTDVLRQSHVPFEWQTLDEQIFRLVSTRSHNIGKLHHDFCINVNSHCAQLLFSAENVEVTPETKAEFSVVNPMFCMSPPKRISYNKNRENDNNTRPESNQSNSDFIFVEEVKEASEEEIQHGIQTLKSDIHAHFDNICQMILTATESCAEFNYRKVWMCYESHFYEATMSQLMNLYHQAYADSAKSFTSELAQLRTEDLDASDYWIDKLIEIDYGSGYGESAEDISLDEQTEVKVPITDFVNDSVEYKVKHQDSSRHSNLKLPDPDTVSCLGIDMGLESLKLDIDSHLRNRTELKIKAASMPACVEKARLSRNRQHPLPLKMKSKYLDVFDQALSCISMAIKEPSPLLKLQQLTKCLQSISTEISLMRENTSVCSDALIDVLVLILLNTDPEKLQMLFIHLHFLADLMAPFMDSGPHNYSLVQFHVTIQYLQDRIVMLKLGRSV